MDTLTESDKLYRLYHYYELLYDSMATDITDKEHIYKGIIQRVNGSNKEKRLVCQFVPRFFKFFPNVYDMAVDAMFDLCEDQDISIRKQVIKELPSLCRDCISQTKKIMLVLSQLLLVKDPSELGLVHTSLISLFKINARDSILGICYHLKYGEEPLRDSCIRFFTDKMCHIAREIATDKENTILKEFKTIVKTGRLEEIPLLLKILLNVNRNNSLQGKNELTAFIGDQLQMNIPFDPYNDLRIERLIVLLKHVNFLFIDGESTYCKTLVTYLCNDVLPNLNYLAGYEEGTGYVIEILQLLSEATCYANELSSCEDCIKIVLSHLMVFLPLNNSIEDKIHFLVIECLLYTLHRLVKYNPEAIENDSNKVKVLKERLNYLCCVTKTYYNSLRSQSDIWNSIFSSVSQEPPHKKKYSLVRNDLFEETYHFRKEYPLDMWCKSRLMFNWKKDIERLIIDQEAETIEMVESNKNSLWVLAIESSYNIIVLASDFLRNPLLCEQSVCLSFKRTINLDQMLKRHSSDDPYRTASTSHNGKHQHVVNRPYTVRPQLPLYTPPTGRYSANFYVIPPY